MGKLVLSAVVAVALPVVAGVDAGKSEETVIYWSPKTKLIVSDFKQAPVADSHFSAGSHLGTGMEIASENEHLKFTVKAYFVPYKSWLKVNDADLLLHEQTHFDIEEYFARLVRKELSKIKVKGRPFEDIRKETDAMFARILAERTAFQEKFDEETGHSANTPKEKEWEAMVKLLLDDTKAYASPELYFITE